MPTPRMFNVATKDNVGAAGNHWGPARRELDVKIGADRHGNRRRGKDKLNQGGRKPAIKPPVGPNAR